MQSEDDGVAPEVFGLASRIVPGFLLGQLYSETPALALAWISSIPQYSLPGLSGVHSSANHRDAVVGKRRAWKHGTTQG
jgi:hypothetical protein